MIAPAVARRIVELRSELDADVQVVAESSDGAAILLMTPGDGSPAFLLICDPANLAASETAH